MGGRDPRNKDGDPGSLHWYGGPRKQWTRVPTRPTGRVVSVGPTGVRHRGWSSTVGGRFGLYRGNRQGGPGGKATVLTLDSTTNNNWGHVVEGFFDEVSCPVPPEASQTSVSVGLLSTVSRLPPTSLFRHTRDGVHKVVLSYSQSPLPRFHGDFIRTLPVPTKSLSRKWCLVRLKGSTRGPLTPSTTTRVPVDSRKPVTTGSGVCRSPQATREERSTGIPVPKNTGTRRVLTLEERTGVLRCTRSHRQN